MRLRDAGAVIPVDDYSVYVVRTPNLPGEDQEALLFDPADGDFYIVQKNHLHRDANIYRFRSTQPTFN